MAWLEPPSAPLLTESNQLQQDPNSYANTHQVRVTHVQLDLTVDFSSKTLKGHVVLTAVAQVDGVTEIVLDSNHLEIDSVSVDGAAAPFVLATAHPVYGRALHITLVSPLSASSSAAVTVAYSTTAACLAAQWLDPAQTVGKQFPYLFTQCQPIYARTLLPVMDTPYVKLTYDAVVRVPRHLRALMSAVPVVEVEEGGLKVCKFKQAIAIPSYLIAIAVGNIEGKRVGPRTTVWSEPEVVEAAAWEFADTEKFIKIGEELLTPYVWGVYDILVLPSSFPYGGMENPCLTFVTPSLLAGDRSLVDVVAHEAAHSWMGNLVTSSNWENFWLNEGFTVCIERKIMGAMHGQHARHFSAIIGEKALKESVEHFEKTGHPEYSCLCPRLANVDPDDVFSSVPYEKGFHLLFYLEELLGGSSVFDHVETFSHRSVTTQEFKDNLYSFFKRQHGDEKVKLLDTVDWDSWFNKPGMPPVKNTFDRTLATACDALAARWLSNVSADESTLRTLFHASDLADFTSPQKVVFLELLLDSASPLPVPVLDVMEQIYGFKALKNCEERSRWCEVSLKAERESVFPDVVEFVTTMGRMKYVRPLYRGLARCKAGKALAQETFTKHRAFYHPICAAIVEKDIMGL
ncbi:peptidase family M1-domain-containing protein [Zopfochytrium polystomum]|nr:peptidase family M1-domain-containing protein [Zopfochytrium polystomum]